MLRRSQRGWSIIATLATASVAMGIVGVSTAQLQAQADEERVPDLILLKDAAHVQMSMNSASLLVLIRPRMLPLDSSRSETTLSTVSMS